MTVSWKDARNRAVELGLDEQRVEDARKSMSDEIRAYRLAEVRKQQDVTQQNVAALMHVSQARVSKIERGELARTELGTLQAYVEALGGRLRVVADFGETRLTVGD